MRKVVAAAALLILAGGSACSFGGREYVKQPFGREPVPESARNVTGSNTQVSATAGALAINDLVLRLESKGLQANATGEQVKELFGAIRVEVVVVEGLPLQVYLFEDGTAAAKAYRIARDPQAHTVSWSAAPHFVQMENLLITVVTNDQTRAKRIVDALQ